jgi:hypothetical protein
MVDAGSAHVIPSVASDLSGGAQDAEAGIGGEKASRSEGTKRGWILPPKMRFARPPPGSLATLRDDIAVKGSFFLERYPSSSARAFERTAFRFAVAAAAIREEPAVMTSSPFFRPRKTPTPTPRAIAASG